MNKEKIFLASSISGFSDETTYRKYREKVLSLIKYLRNSLFDVYSEIERVTGKSNYDSPEQSVNEDFKKIDNSDIFLLLHPQKMQTSALIELGYAYAQKKTIIIIGSLSALPYLALGLPAVNAKVRIINSSDLNEEIFATTITTINNCKNFIESEIHK